MFARPTAETVAVSIAIGHSSRGLRIGSSPPLRGQIVGAMQISKISDATFGSVYSISGANPSRLELTFWAETNCSLFL